MTICILREEDRGTTKSLVDGTKVTYFTPTVFGEKVMSPRADVAAAGGYGIRRTRDGKQYWQTLNEQGNWEERDGVIENLRSWETFFPGNPGATAWRAGVPYFFKTVEHP